MKHRIFLLFFFIVTGLTAQVNTRITKEEYIYKYRLIAVNEMLRTGIPASITLAQGMLESSNGNSELAVKANNHFGIKCHKDWTGQRVYMDDDTIAECFRVYGSPEESFTDHSHFLTNRGRYSFLFELQKTDYQGWAHGLKKAGYATNPQYAFLLIDLIEKNNLHQYDLMTADDLEKMMKEEKPNISHTRPPLPKPALSKVIKINNTDAYLVGSDDESPLSVADKFQMMPWQIYKYNDLPKNQFQFKKGDIVYLKPKRRKGHNPTHKVGNIETVWEISQLEGIKLKMLLKRNHLEKGEEVAAGEVLVLSGHRDGKPKTRTAAQIQQTILKMEQEKRDKIVRDSLFKVQQQQKIDSARRIKNGDTIRKKPVEIIKPIDSAKVNSTIKSLPIDSPKVTPKPVDVPKPIEKPTPKDSLPTQVIAPPTEEYYTVGKKETAYGISKKFGLTVDQLLKLNNLSDPALKEGQRIRVK